MEVCRCIYIIMYMYVILMFNTHWPFLIQRSGRAEGYAATLCTVPLDLTSVSGYATVTTVYSRCIYIFLGNLKKEFNESFIHVEGLESQNIFSRCLHETLHCSPYVVLKTEHAGVNSLTAVDRENNKMQLISCLLSNFCLKMFRTSLSPSSVD